jgi:Domain of unknown function (DUF4129)
MSVFAANSQSDPAQVANDILQSHEFWWKRIEHVNPDVPWLQRVLTAIGNFLGDILSAFARWVGNLFEWLFRALGVTGDWSTGTLLVALVAIILLAWAIWKLLPKLLEWLRRSAPAARPAERLISQELPEATKLYEEATRALSEGKFAEALRLAFLALIARLQEQGLLRYDPARTNREYQADLGRLPDLAALFSVVARPYERVWYGRMPASGADAKSVLDDCRPVVMERVAPL